jgi:hypothetical protein
MLRAFALPLVLFCAALLALRWSGAGEGAAPFAGLAALMYGWWSLRKRSRLQAGEQGSE